MELSDNEKEIYYEIKKSLQKMAESRFGKLKDNKKDIIEKDKFIIEFSNYDMTFEINYHNEKFIECPHCKEKTMKAIKLDDKRGTPPTYMWVCIQCPNVLFEYSYPEDVERVEEYLNRV